MLTTTKAWTTYDLSLNTPPRVHGYYTTPSNQSKISRREHSMKEQVLELIEKMDEKDLRRMLGFARGLEAGKKTQKSNN